jgi:hypothetical protein
LQVDEESSTAHLFSQQLATRNSQRAARNLQPAATRRNGLLRNQSCTLFVAGYMLMKNRAQHTSSANNLQPATRNLPRSGATNNTHGQHRHI